MLQPNGSLGQFSGEGLGPMEFQYINIKLYLDDSRKVNLGDVVPIFHSWIQDQSCEELLIDVTDYRHVHGGPGVVLIGHQADYSLDNTDDRLGIRYNRKEFLEGNNFDRFKQAMRSALIACQQLESDARLNGSFRFGQKEFHLYINDRLLAPNVEATYSAAKPELDDFFQNLFGGSDYSIRHNGDPRRLFGVSVKTSRPFSPEELLKNLS